MQRGSPWYPGETTRTTPRIDVERGRAFEWSTELDGWEILAPDATIEDRVLVAALVIRDLVSAGSADDAVARALLATGNAVVRTAVDEGRARGRAEGRAQAIVAILVARGLTPQEHERDLILATDDDDVLSRWLATVATCTSVAELVATSR